MNLDQFWERVFSEDRALVQLAWDSLTSDERTVVHEMLEKISADPERIAEQRVAARYALNVIRDERSGMLESPASSMNHGMPDTINKVAIEPGVTKRPVSLQKAEVSRQAPSKTPAMADMNALPPGALDFARELAHQTGERLKHASGQLIASVKQDGTLVTASDIEADQQLGKAILARYPDHSVLSEEGDRVYGGQEWCWMIDPIDGTTNFTWGMPAWGVLIALLHHGQPVLGVAEFPPVGLQLYAAKGQGAWRETENGDGDGPIHVAIDTSLTSTQLFALGTHSLGKSETGKGYSSKSVPDLPCKLRMPGSSGFDFALVACGVCVGAFDATVHVWDIAALWPIVEEAGGRCVTNRPGGIFPLSKGIDYSEVEFTALGAGTGELLQVFLTSLSDRFRLP